MARSFRLWEKKRGNRQTGSRLVGSLGEAAFFATMFLLGVVSLTALIMSRTFLAAPRFQPGFGFWVMVLVLSSFVLLGGGGVLWTVFHVGASAERRLALARRAAALDPTTGRVERDRFPGIPSDKNLTNSPGVELPYRLPMLQSTAWRLVFGSLFCLIWNGSAAVLVVVVIRGHWSGHPEWFLTIFTVPFVAIGGYALHDFIRQLLLHTGIGPTIVEIGRHPLRPGHACEVYVSQAGRLTMRVISLRLICEEQVAYRQGTDVRSESRRVFDRQLFRETRVAIQPGSPYERTITMEIPRQAMHSFQSEHNAINWKLVVNGEAESWPPFERGFPLIVYPADDGRQGELRTAGRGAD